MHLDIQGFNAVSHFKKKHHSVYQMIDLMEWCWVLFIERYSNVSTKEVF